jgi:Ser/Thr protein kinase RdoA (MazF antagonist)
MMNLSTLWSLDRTVDPGTGRSPIADSIAAVWDHDPGTVRMLRSSANFIYRLERNGRPAYLRIAAASERSVGTIATEVEMLDWLHDGGLPVVRPIPARNGELVVTRETEIGQFHAVLFDAVEGQYRDLDDLSLADMQAWGATVGRVHATLTSAPARFRKKVPAWQASIERVTSGLVPVPQAVRHEGNRLQAMLQPLPTTPDAYGLLHNDLELDNLRWTGSQIGMLDFDEYADGWYLLDIAKALSDVMDEGDTLASPRIAAFVAGYRLHHVLDDDMLRHLPDFAALSQLRDYMSLVRAIDIEEAAAEVDWMRDLIHRLRTWMREYERGLELAAG